MNIVETILAVKKTKIKYRLGKQGVRTGYAWLGNSIPQYIWVFDNPNDVCGFTIRKENLIEVCKGVT